MLSSRTKGSRLGGVLTSHIQTARVRSLAVYAARDDTVREVQANVGKAHAVNNQFTRRNEALITKANRAQCS